MHPAARFTRPSPSAGNPSGLTVWVAQSSARLAIDLAARLHGLDVAVRVWDDSVAPMPVPLSHDLAAAGPATRPIDARGPADRVADTAVAPVWRGGLAPGALRRVRDHIESTLSERIDLGALARMVGLSDCHFSRAFRQSVGVPRIGT
jgi:transcriptional regulator GlxA family with amidase domain